MWTTIVARPLGTGQSPSLPGEQLPCVQEERNIYLSPIPPSLPPSLHPSLHPSLLLFFLPPLLPPPFLPLIPPSSQLGKKARPARAYLLRRPQHQNHDVAEADDGECASLPAVAAAGVPHNAGEEPADAAEVPLPEPGPEQPDGRRAGATARGLG